VISGSIGHFLLHDWKSGTFILLIGSNDVFRKRPFDFFFSRFWVWFARRPRCPTPASMLALIRTHFINRHEMRSSQKGSGLFGRIAALRIEVKTSSLDLDSRLALHPKQDKLALAPIDEMSSSYDEKPLDVDPLQS
jgi:hypothetical protein